MGLGIGLYEDETGSVCIESIAPLSPAALSGRLALHDRIVAVNDVSCEGMPAIEVVSQLVSVGEGRLIHLRVQPASSNHAPDLGVWVLHYGDHSVPTWQQGDSLGSVGAVVSEGDEDTLWHVERVKVGGAAWLGAAHASMQSSIAHGEIEHALREGDWIETVDGQSVCNADAPAVLRGPCFTRMSMGIMRNGIPLFVDIIRSPVLTGEPLRQASAYLSALWQTFSMHHSEEASSRRFNAALRMPPLSNKPPTLHRQEASRRSRRIQKDAAPDASEEDAAPDASKVEAVARMIHSDLDKVLPDASEEDAAPDASKVEAVTRMIHSDLDKVLSSLANPSPTLAVPSHLKAVPSHLKVQPSSTHSASHPREHSPGRESRKLALDRVRDVLGTVDAFKPTSRCQDTCEERAVYACADNLWTGGVNGISDAVHAILNGPGPVREVDNSLHEVLPARQDLEHLNDKQEQREREQEGELQRTLNGLRDEKELLYSQIAQARQDLEHLHDLSLLVEGSRSRAGEKPQHFGGISSILKNPLGFLAPSQPEMKSGEESRGMRQSGGGMRQSPKEHNPEKEFTSRMVLDGRAPELASVQVNGGDMHLERRKKHSAENTFKSDSYVGSSAHSTVSAHEHALDMISQREQAVRAALGLTNHVSPARKPLVATDWNVDLQKMQEGFNTAAAQRMALENVAGMCVNPVSLSRSGGEGELDRKARKEQERGMAELNGRLLASQPPRVLHAVPTSARQHGAAPSSDERQRLLGQQHMTPQLHAQHRQQQQTQAPPTWLQAQPPPTNGGGAAQVKEKHVRRVLNMIDAGLSDLQILHHGALTHSSLTLSQISNIRDKLGQARGRPGTQPEGAVVMLLSRLIAEERAMSDVSFIQ